MASVTRRIEVCDICRELDRPIVARVRMAPEGERLRLVAFCSPDFGPMKSILDSIEVKSPAPAGRRASRKVTLDQIEEIKATRTGKRAAKAVAPARRARKAPVAASKG